MAAKLFPNSLIHPHPLLAPDTLQPNTTVLTQVAEQAEDVRDVLERVGVRALDAVELVLLGVGGGLGVRRVEVGVLDWAC